MEAHCPLYLMTGTCRHGDQCSGLHDRPAISRTLLLSHIYQRPDTVALGADSRGRPIDPRRLQKDFEWFYEDIFEKISMFGEIESLDVCDNLADHMVGNAYVRFVTEGDAAAALEALEGRSYAGRPIVAEFSPVTDLRDATCRPFEKKDCKRRGYCNFVHLKKIGRELRSELFYKR